METKRCVFVGVGGQGNLLASNLLGQAALSMGIPVVVSEIHGMAQRGGVVESAVLLGGANSPIVSNGEADVLISFEPLETMRILAKCNNKTLVITNAQPLPPFTVAVGQGKYPPVDEILDKVEKKVGKVVALQGNDLAHFLLDLVENFVHGWILPMAHRHGKRRKGLSVRDHQGLVVAFG
ncbi:MAG: 2-oxoacid:acceptor oxidoreductase family protein, partial [Deltaproteobacteria bacterium]|nr:2-oxoacid:acceptor oxidoreductase family protein [Deltaproteobacteria bacterium]